MENTKTSGKQLSILFQTNKIEKLIASLSKVWRSECKRDERTTDPTEPFITLLYIIMMTTFDGVASTSEIENNPKTTKITRRCLLIVSLTFILTTIALAIALLVLTFWPKSHEVCTSKQCTLAAATILKYMDLTQDPCQDFFSFVCGNYMKLNENVNKEQNIFEESRRILDLQLKELLEKNNSETDPKAVHKLRKAYQVCMNTSHTTELGITPFIKFLELLGGWPVAIGPKWLPVNGTKLEDLLAKMERMGFSSYIIAVNISPDPVNNTIYKIQFDQADENYRQLKDTKFRFRKRWIQTDWYDPVQAIVLAIVESLGNKNKLSILKDINDIKRLKRDLNKIFTPKEQRKNHTRMYNKMTLRQLKNLTNNVFDFHSFLQSIFVGVTEISEDEEVIVCEVEFMRKWPLVISKYNRRVITNYAIWNAVEILIQFITPELYVNSAKFKSYLESDFVKIRWKLCLSAMEDMLPYSVWRVFVDNFVESSSLESATEFVDNLRNAFKKTILHSNWLDLDTKRSAVKKINAMKEFVGYPGWILNNSKLNNYYENLEIIDNHFINVIVNRMNTTYRILNYFRQPVDKELWVDETSFVNAFYSHLTNSIFFPAGILRPPFYGVNRLQALNYGSIGVIVGHEMGHGFDSDGSQFDENGILRRWWSDRSREMYTNRTECFIKQYSEYCVPDLKQKNNLSCVNGNFTIGENLADNVGLQCSYKAYQQWVKDHSEEGRLPGLEEYSPDQLFFISHAITWCQTIPYGYSRLNDPHAPSRYRVQGPLSNSVEFAQLFNCPAGPMNRADQRCTLW